MAWLVQQFSSDNGIQLGAEEIIRPFTFGTNWKVIRIGLRLAVNGYNTLSVDGPNLGVCTGTNGAFYQTATDAIYWRPWTTTGGLTQVWSGTAPGVYRVQTINFPISTFQRVGSTVTAMTGNSFVRPAISANPTYWRSMLFLDIDKGTIGGSDLGMTIWFCQDAVGNGSVLQDYSRGDFLAAMQWSSPPRMAGLGASSPTLTARTAKDWNAAFVAWPFAVPTVCLYDMAVVRFI